MTHAEQVMVVTDSTASLPKEVIDAGGMTVISCQVVVGDRALDEQTQATGEMVAAALRERVQVTTSRPSPEHFLAAYRAAAEAGAIGVVSVHLSADVSGTHQSARLAAAEAPIEVRVVDSRSVGMGLGFAVMAAAETARSGGALDDVVAAAEKRAAACSTYFYVDTLEHLRRGGRIGAAQARLGSVLAVKPLLHIVGGRIVPLEKVRTAGRAMARLEEIVVGQAQDGQVDIAMHYLGNRERTEAMAERFRDRLPDLRNLYVTEIGAVIGAHAGPGMLGVVVSAL